LGHVKTTKHRRPLKLIHKELFVEKGQAYNRERFLKSLWGSREKQKIKREFLDKKNRI
jgi:predicted GIY-YIG superfamily endonuclease